MALPLHASDVSFVDIVGATLGDVVGGGAVGIVIVGSALFLAPTAAADEASQSPAIVSVDDGTDDDGDNATKKRALACLISASFSCISRPQ